MKKLLSILLAALLLAPLCAAVPASAADEVNIAVDTAGEVLRGTVGVELAVRVSASPRWGALQASVEFDPTALCFTGFELNPELRRQISEGEPCVFGVNDENAATGAVSFGYASAYEYGGAEGYFPGEYDYFGTLTFDVRSDAPLGYTQVSVSVTELSRSEDDLPAPVAYSVANGGMTLLCGHEWQAAETVPAGCEEDGYVRFVCAGCGDEYTETLPAVGHSWGEWTESKPASCTEFGVEIRFCNNDHSHYQVRQTDSLGHAWGEWETASAATCAAAGSETRICSRCNETETREIPIDPDAHAWGEWEVTSPATCEAAAVETRVCANDPAHTETREGEAALGHSFGEWTETKEPSCTEAGEETRYCSRCDAFETREVDALGHAWGEWETASAATCAAAGSETRICSRCNETETREIPIDPDAHAWGEWEVTSPATCEAAAVETRVCANDASHVESRETGEPDPDAHDWGEWQVTKPATVFEDGEETRVCKNDPSHIETRVIPKPEYVVCDVDFDGEITVSDALRALRAAAKLDEADELIRAAADADCDGEVTVADALAILRRALGIVSE